MDNFRILKVSDSTFNNDDTDFQYFVQMIVDQRL